MVNTETNSSAVGSDGVATIAHKQSSGVAGVAAEDKQSSGTVKKAALRDVQNQNIGLARSPLENLSFLGGGLNKDAAVKVCGNKRLTPEPPSGSPLFPAFTKTHANELIMNARRRFELELGVPRCQISAKKTIDSSKSREFNHSQLKSPPKQSQAKGSVNYSTSTGATSNIVPPLPNPGGGPSVPTFVPKYGSGKQAAHTDSLKVTVDCPNSNAFKVTDDKRRADRIIQLEEFLTECDESRCKDYIILLRHLSHSELSRRAVDLEKRAIHLTIEEGKEMQRMKALNIFEKPFSTVNPGQTLAILQARK